MPRLVSLFTGPFIDMPLADLAGRASEWGYTGLELAAWGEHLEIQRALAEPDYGPQILSLLAQHDLQLSTIANFRVGQAVCDLIDERHQSMVPDYVWGDGKPDGVRNRAAEEMIATVRVAQQLGVAIVSGFTGSQLWSYVAGYPGPSAETVRKGLDQFARAWNPILDVCADAGIRFAAEVHPGQIAFDIYSAAEALKAVNHRPEFGFTLDPCHLHWQGIDPVAFIREFPDRIFHVHVKDCALTLDGRSGILNSYLPYGDSRRGWEPRSAGRGGIDWESFIRALNVAGYDGALSVDWRDEGLERDFGVEEACQFVRKLDAPAPSREQSAFR